ncbi:Cleavage and polyadenylation specificity factor subunit 1, partial [Linum perenne]
STCTVSVKTPPAFQSSKKAVSACTLYHDKGPEPWLRKTSTDAWLSTGISEPLDGTDGGAHDHGDIYCIICYESGALEIFDVPNFSSVFYVDKFVSGKSHLADSNLQELSDEPQEATNTSSGADAAPVGILTDGTILCYHAYLFEGPDSSSKTEASVATQDFASRLRNLRFARAPLDTYMREETSSGNISQRMTIFTNISGHQGFFLSGSRPAWFMVLRERLRIHPQVRVNKLASL